MAHFRRFYTTVTALSYHFPPRNTLAGIVAAVIGRERDTYYDLFSRRKCQVGVSILTPIRRLVLSLNNLDIDSVDFRRLRGRGGRHPTTTELLLAEPPHEKVSYRIIFSHDNSTILDELHARLRSRRFAYPPALGPAFCLADLQLAFDGEAQLIEAHGEEFGISTVVRDDLVAPNGLIFKEGLRIMLEERLPPDFVGAREPAGRSSNYFFEANGKPIPLRINGEVFRFLFQGQEVHGVFM